jgi:hypothetical protein
VRRALAVLALLGPVLAVVPASAHSCAAPVQVPVGERVSVTVGVTAEAVAVTGVDVSVPDDFRLLGVVEAPGWRIERRGSTVRLRDGEVAPFGCAYLALEGVAGRKGRLVFPLTVHGADGSTLRYESAELGDPGAGQLVFAGVERPSPDTGGVSPWKAAGWALVTLGLVGAAALALRRFILRPRPRPAAGSAAGGRGRHGSGSSRFRTRRPPRPRRR